MSLISVITINYNNAEGLEKTISSVINQSFRNFEFLIIDGHSSDKSVDIIKQSNRIDFWLSEKDKGIYDAQNKGIKQAKGDYLLFLNSGDTLFDNNVFQKFSDFSGNEKDGIVYGNTNLITENKSNELLVPSQKLDLNYLFRHNINHQSCFIKRNLFEKYGLYSLKYKICADFDFFFKVFVAEPEVYRYHNFTVCNYEVGGLSSNKENYDLVVSEKQSILKNYLPTKVYHAQYKSYRSEIPLKYRIFGVIYKIPVLNFLFKKLYQVTKGNG